jgi:hypothetical protein
MNARADVFTAHVQRGDVALARSEWTSLWDDALTSNAWERWLVSGRIAAARAELEFVCGHLGDALTWATRALELARASSRPKYEAIARTALGRTLTALGRYGDAASELRSAMALADSLGTPLLRWQSRAALARALAGAGADPDPFYEEASRMILSVAAELNPQRSAAYLAAPQVAEVVGKVS